VTDPFDGHWDAIVVGAGPAGSACAWHLASAGRRVLLLERHHFPRDKSCGDGLTPRCLALLDEMGVLPRLQAFARIARVRVVHRGPPLRHRDVAYDGVPGACNYGLVVPRRELDHILCQAAVAAGAVLVEGVHVRGLLRDGERAIGVLADSAGRQGVPLHAEVVVAADGAHSRLAAGMGLGGGAGELGFALRGYCDGVRDLDPYQEIHLPLADATGDYLLPSYGWIFPTGPTSANVGVGIIGRTPLDDVRRLSTRFWDALRASDPRFRDAWFGTPLLGAPLRFDFSPDRCAAPGLLLVGDAAGLTSPFSGEGISYGLESGRLAARTIDGALRFSPRRPAVADDYCTLMGHHFAGYFEMGRRSARRHLLFWKVLDSSFDSERTIFALLRRATLLPEAAVAGGEHALLDDLGPLIGRGDPLLRRQLLDIGAALVAVVRRDWPFIGRLDVARSSARGIVFRPSLLMLLAARFGDAHAPGLVQLGVALDLAYLGLMAQTCIEEDQAGMVDNWSNKFALLLGDFLFAHALCEASPGNASHGDAIMAALETSCRGCLAQLATAGHADVAPAVASAQMADRIAPLFILPFQIGAAAAGVAPAVAAALVSYGRALGLLFACGEELLAFTDRPVQALAVLASDLTRRVAGLPLLYAAQSAPDAVARALHADPPDRAALAALVAQAAVQAAMADTMAQHAQDAGVALQAVPATSAAAALHALVRHGLERAGIPALRSAGAA
jgi:geranylgeranyl reductase family protein